MLSTKAGLQMIVIAY